MNTSSPPDLNSDRHARRLPSGDRAWVADWRNFVILHFSVAPNALAAEVPYELELYDGRAWVSLVWFELWHLRFADTGRVGRWACRPISNHPFLNVRTYVRHDAGPGICFLAEWIPNRLNVVLGPLTYGLPYRHGRFTTERRRNEGIASLRIDPRHGRASFALTMPFPADGGATCARGSLAAFLLERYQAYTFHHGRGARFRVAHAAWLARRADWVRYDLGFLRDEFPFFRAATFECAHLCESQRDVEMGLPHRLNLPGAPLGLLPNPAPPCHV